MLGKTHFFIGISTALAVLQPQSVPVLVTGISAAAVGSVISDIDSGTSQAHQEADKVMAVTVSVIGLMLFLEYKFHLGIYERLMKNSSIMRVLTGGILFLIVTSICGIYMLYASMSLGQLMEDHRVAGSFLAYIGLNMAVSTITNIGTMIVTNILPDNLVNITAGNAGLIITLYMLIMLVINGIQLAVYHMITEYVLTNKLNLE